MSLKLNELKKLHDLGFSLLYLYEKDKRPLDKKWTTTPNKTWDEIENSFEKEYNVGVRLGEHSKIAGSGGYLACIDVDIKNPSAKKKAYAELSKLTGGKAFPTVRSGSGGGSLHKYFVSKKPFKMITIIKVKDEFEICLYSTGRQMVLPPSIHPDTEFKYAWENSMPTKGGHFPVIDVSKYQVEKEDAAPIDDLNFKAVDVDLYSTSLAVRFIKMIEDGIGVSDRSDDLFACTLAMCRVGFTDNQILSVLSKPENWIASAAYDHTQSNSRARAVKWLYKYTLKKARYETDIMRRFEGVKHPGMMSDEEAEEVHEKLEDLSDKILPDLDKGGKPKNTLKNITHILESKAFMGGGLVGKDEFSNRIFFLKDTVYGGKKGQELTDQDDLELKHYLASHYRFEPGKELCYEAHAVVAHQNRYHPVRSYLETLVWDKTPRLDSWLKRAFGAVGPDAYVSAVGRKVLVAAVNRVYDPGVKFDHMMVLEGFQGKGKSTALRILAGDKWFTDGLGDIHQKDVVDQMMGKWIIEVGELASIKKSDVENVKSFITRQTDRVRMPYGRRSGDFPRQSIFVGTTNNDEYFSDETGNRRFWPIKINEADFKWLKKNRNQLWAEAVHKYEACENLYLEKEIEAIASKEQSKRYITDEWEASIKELVRKTKEDSGRLVLTTTQVWRDITEMGGNEQPRDHDTKRVGKILRRLGFQRKTARVGGVLMKCWVKNALLPV